MPTLEPTVLKLLGPLALFAASLFFFHRRREKAAVFTLLLAAAALRLVMITLDPYLHPWDERFHALVAKNLMTDPLLPVLRRDPILPYDATAWCCNHVWLHKPPLFLWQMALSMKLFGVNLFALRLPSAVLGTLGVYFTFRIARIWARQFVPAYVAAWLAALSYFQLELTSGQLSLDHNDVAFTFYVTASLWAFCEYTRRPVWAFAALTGLLAGAAVLVKWLPGVLVFAGWVVYLALHPGLPVYRRAVPHFAAALVLCLAVFLPWQLYTMERFPLESAALQVYNWQTIGEMGSDPNPAFHLFQFGALYHWVFLPLLLLGLAAALRRHERALTVALVCVAAALYAFFTFAATKTKAPAWPFPVSAVVFSLIAMGWYAGLAYLQSYVAGRAFAVAGTFGLAATGLCALKPWEIVNFRLPDNTAREAAMHNTLVYRTLHRTVPPDHILLNCRQYQDTDIMFWQHHNAFYWFPNRREVQRLLDAGYKIAAIENSGDHLLPDYLLENAKVVKLRLPLR